MSSRNRIANCHNHHQGQTKKVLCVGFSGMLRSPTAANVLFDTYGYNTRSAGVAENYALILVDDALLAWADEVVFMAQSHVDTMYASFPDDFKEYRVLDIPDVFDYMNDDLQEIIIAQYEEAV